MFKKRKIKKEIESIARLEIDGDTVLIFNITKKMGAQWYKYTKSYLTETFGCKCVFLEDGIELTSVSKKKKR